MALVLRSLSDFKRFLSEPGATIQVVRNTFIERQPASFGEAYRAKGMDAPRTIRAVSKKAAIFSVQGHPTTIWLYWDKGTRKWRFDGDTVAIPLDTGLGPPDEIVYRCSYAPGTGPQPQVPAKAIRKPAGKSAGKSARKPATAGAAKSPPPSPRMPARGQGSLI